MLDHACLSVSDINRWVAFNSRALAPIEIVTRVDYDGKDGPSGHPDLKGFGRNSPNFYWLREGVVEGQAVHVCFVADSQAEVNAA